MRLSRLMSMLIWGAGGLFAALGFIVFVNADGKLEQSPFIVSDGNKFDGTYDFRFTFPGPSGTETINLSGFLIISDSNISSSDGSLQGIVNDTNSTSGYITFTGPCPTNDSIADFRGNMQSLSSKNGNGTYQCRDPIGGDTAAKRWWAD